jgi:hypothetical protein
MKICLKRDQASAGPSTGQQEGNQQNQNQDQVPNDTPKDQDEAPSCNKDAECNMLMEGATCNQETKKCQSPTGPPPCAEQLKMDPKRADHFCEMAYKQYAICDKTTKKCKDGAKPDLTITEKTSTQKNTERKQAEDAITKRKGEEKDQMDEFFKTMEECSQTSKTEAECVASANSKMVDKGANVEDLEHLKKEAAMEKAMESVKACFEDSTKSTRDCEQKGEKAFKDLGLDETGFSMKEQQERAVEDKMAKCISNNTKVKAEKAKSGFDPESDSAMNAYKEARRGCNKEAEDEFKKMVAM